MTHAEIAPLLTEWIQKYELSHGEWCKLTTPLTFEHYEAWIREDCHGEMSYLERHSPFKKEPHTRYPFIRSYISLAQSYFPSLPPSEISEATQSNLRIASYARGKDYHDWFQKKLQTLCDELSALFPQEIFFPASDSQPLLERDMAYRAGLGWFGKNTCLIHPRKGSLFFLGEILTSLDIGQTPAPLPDFCGTCTRCIEICPTQALSSPRHLDARKCISYWTIESKSTPPQELRAQFGDHFFGCDLCQTVCPWNEKIFKGQLETRIQRDLSPHQRAEVISELRFILRSSDAEIKRHWQLSPLLRAKAFGLKRNALIVIANLGLDELKRDVLEISDPRLEELKQWTLEKLHS
jgi:epoxyqueuosine reductase